MSFNCTYHPKARQLVIRWAAEHDPEIEDNLSPIDILLLALSKYAGFHAAAEEQRVAMRMRDAIEKSFDAPDGNRPKAVMSYATLTVAQRQMLKNLLGSRVWIPATHRTQRTLDSLVKKGLVWKRPGTDFTYDITPEGDRVARQGV